METSYPHIEAEALINKIDSVPSYFAKDWVVNHDFGLIRPNQVLLGMSRFSRISIINGKHILLSQYNICT